MAFLRDKAIGDIVKIKENGEPVNYIIVHKGLPSDMYDSSCDGIWLLRELYHSRRSWHGSNSSSNWNDYEKSDINTWLNETFFNTMDSEIRSAIKTVKIPYKKGAGNSSTPVQTGANGLSCNVFLLSGYEVGFTQAKYKSLPIDGAKLSYFSDDASRKCTGGNSANFAEWHLRSPCTGDEEFVNRVEYSGGYTNGESYYSEAVRPAFILPSSLVLTSDGFVSLNNIPTITSDTAPGSDMGEISEPFNIVYTVNDVDNDTMTVTEHVDDVQQRSYTATLGAENSFEAVSDPVLFQKILNGQHTLKIIANDTKDDSEPYTVTFNKQVKTAVISLAEPLPADDVIKAAVVSITGQIPQDAAIEVLVTNNALDENPVWENMTQDFEKRINHVFANKTAANGFAFNFKVKATRGASGEQGFISNIGGAFE